MSMIEDEIRAELEHRAHGGWLEEMNTDKLAAVELALAVSRCADALETIARRVGG